MKRFFLFFVVAMLATLSALHLSKPARHDGISPASQTANTPDAATHKNQSQTNAASASPVTDVQKMSESNRSETTGPAIVETRRRPWDPDFFTDLRETSTGDPIRFELVSGEFAVGRVQRLQHRNGETIYVSGRLTVPEQGRFFFQKQAMPGKAGGFVGVVEFPNSKRAYRIEPSGTDGASELVELPLDAVVCLQLPMPTSINEAEQFPPLNPSDFPTVPIPEYQGGIIPLESLHGAEAVVYLDYRGGFTQ